MPTAVRSLTDTSTSSSTGLSFTSVTKTGTVVVTVSVPSVTDTTRSYSCLSSKSSADGVLTTRSLPTRVPHCPSKSALTVSRASPVASHSLLLISSNASFSFPAVIVKTNVSLASSSRAHSGSDSAAFATTVLSLGSCAMPVAAVPVTLISGT